MGDEDVFYINFINVDLNLFTLQVVITENRVPHGEHPRRYNRQIGSEVAILMPGEPTSRRDIIINQHDGGLKKVNELHPSYDALQYPLIYFNAVDSYGVNCPETQMKHYSYKMMVRR